MIYLATAFAALAAFLAGLAFGLPIWSEPSACNLSLIAALVVTACWRKAA